MKENALLEKKEREIAILSKKRYEINEKIEHEENKEEYLWLELKKGREMNSSYFYGNNNENYKKELRKIIEKLDLDLKIKTFEFQRIKKKRDKIIEMDQKERKQFYKNIEEKDRKEAEDLMQTLNGFKDGGEGDGFFTG